MVRLGHWLGSMAGQGGRLGGITGRVLRLFRAIVWALWSCEARLSSWVWLLAWLLAHADHKIGPTAVGALARFPVGWDWRL